MSKSVSLSDATAAAAVDTISRVLASSRVGAAAEVSAVNLATSFFASSVSSSSGADVFLPADPAAAEAAVGLPSPRPCSAWSSRLL